MSQILHGVAKGLIFTEEIKLQKKAQKMMKMRIKKQLGWQGSEQKNLRKW